MRPNAIPTFRIRVNYLFELLASAQTGFQELKQVIVATYGALATKGV
ncbi:MAG: hypothetical protein M3261_02155 [Thermoproteota archaeon]|nr:hypothetical protein [Thermoproteota archaeon]